MPVVRAGTPMRLRRRGMGEQLSDAWCNSAWSLLDPAAWLGGCVASDYQKLQYGTPPAVVKPPAPTVSLTPNANAPGAIYAGTDSSGAAVYAVPQTAAENRQAMIDAQNAAYDAAVANGYNPAGNLPNPLDLSNFWSRYGTYIMIGGGAVLALVVANSVGGHRR